jgi:hypothetical protein
LTEKIKLPTLIKMTEFCLVYGVKIEVPVFLREDKHTDNSPDQDYDMDDYTDEMIQGELARGLIRARIDSLTSHLPKPEQPLKLHLKCAGGDRGRGPLPPLGICVLAFDLGVTECHTATMEHGHTSDHSFAKFEPVEIPDIVEAYLSALCVSGGNDGPIEEPAW